MGENVFVSVRGRVILNAEALNMTESVGNYVRHRRVPVVMRRGAEYVTIHVPAVSGEAVAHGYQELLAKEALSKGLNVCGLCSKGIFLKSTTLDVVQYAHGDQVVDIVIEKNQLTKKKGKERKAEILKIAHEFEKTIIANCTVEDVGGFLYAARRDRLENKGKIAVKQVKRTSNFYVGYMIPVAEGLEAAVTEAQLHSRYALGTEFVEAEEGERGVGQMIYYVEIASAPYTFSFDLDTRYVGRTTFVTTHAGEPAVSKEERVERIKAALNALKRLVLELGFGAKKTRFLPTVEWESLVVAVSDNVWTVPSPFSANYVEAAKKKLSLISENTKLHVYEAGKEKTLEEVLEEAIKDAVSRVEKP